MGTLEKNTFAEIQSGRRVVFEFPVPNNNGKATSENSMVDVIVMDSAIYESNLESECAAMVVPKGMEEEWIFSTEQGQWQLLASAHVRRLILIIRKCDDPISRRRRFKNRAEAKGKSEEDEELKNKLGMLATALAPRSSFRFGPPVIPFLSYVDNIISKIIVEEVCSPLNGLMVVEDVEVISDETADSVFRRRLRFQRVPNLIQTEVPLVIQQSTKSGKKRFGNSSKLNREQGRDLLRKHGSRFTVDNSRLVHVYLAPIVAGLCLIGSSLEEWMRDGRQVKVLMIGIGGGALPAFLHKHFKGFKIEAWDIDNVVLDLAKKYFGLVEDENLKIRACDGLSALEGIVEQITGGNFLSDKLKQAWKDLLGSELRQEDSSSTTKCSDVSIDPRFNVIIVDVDAQDVRLGLSAPPLPFVSKRFLLAACIAMHEVGLLAINILSCEAVQYREIVIALKEVFCEIYEIEVKNCENYVVFALPLALGKDVSHNILSSKVKSLIDNGLSDMIRKV